MRHPVSSSVNSDRLWLVSRRTSSLISSLRFHGKRSEQHPGTYAQVPDPSLLASAVLDRHGGSDRVRVDHDDVPGHRRGSGAVLKTDSNTRRESVAGDGDI